MNGAFQQCITKCRSIVRDYLSLTSGPPSLDIRRRTITTQTPYQAVELILRSQYELGKLEQIFETITNYFHDLAGAPYSTILLTCSILDSEDDFQSIRVMLEETIRQRETSLLPNEFNTLLKIIVSKGYIPLNFEQEGLIFIAANKRLALDLIQRAELLSQLQKSLDQRNQTDYTQITSSELEDQRITTQLSQDKPEISETKIVNQVNEENELDPNLQIIEKQTQYLKELQNMKQTQQPFLTFLQKVRQIILRWSHQIFSSTQDSLIGKVLQKTWSFFWKFRYVLCWLIIIYFCLPLIRLIRKHIVPFPFISHITEEITKALKIAFTLGTGGRF